MKSTVQDFVFRFPVFIASGCLLLNASAQPYGLEQRPVVSPFINGVIPPAEANPSAWQAVVAFPNLTFQNPTLLVREPGTNRLYVCEQEGRIYHFPNVASTTNKTLFLDLSASTQGYNDSGLLGFAFHPQFGVPGSPHRGYVYVYRSYSPSPVAGNPYAPDTTPSYNRLSRFTVPDGSLVADPASELVLINQLDQHLWHNGGGMFFGPDGFLYLSNGDGGGPNDQYNNSQKINFGLFSGVLRIDVDKDPVRSHAIRRQPQSAVSPPQGWPPTYSSNYFIPNDNPWVTNSGIYLEEFYAIGFRSPHRMTYDALSDRVWLGDVGEATWEEVDIIVKGGNYQWAYREGDNPGPKAKPSPLIGTDRPPVQNYLHANGDNCVIGGHVYRGSAYPSLYGKYLFGDNGSGRIWAMTYDGINPTVVTQLCVMPAPVGTYGLTSFGLDQANEVYMTIAGSGTRIYRLSVAGTSVPPPPALLSQTGVFTNMLSMAPNAFMIPYTVNTPLWSDGARKGRWMIVPTDGAPYGAGETVGFSTNGNWLFPTGTVFVKHFELPLNETNLSVTKRLETRLLVHGTNDQWFGFTYKWRADNSDADLLPGGLNETNLITTASGVRTQVWYYPSRSDCQRCHNANAGAVLGPRTAQFNGTNFYPSTGVTDNQIRALNHIGLFDTPLNEASIPGYPQMAPLDHPTASLETKVRSYLDSNCAHCHRPNGARGLFDARFSTPLESQGLVNGAVSDNLGIPGARVIKPQDLSSSILFLRDSALGGIQMPPLARNQVDQEYTNVLAAWINNLPVTLDLPSGLVGTVGNTNSGTQTDGLWFNGAWINTCQFLASSNMTAAFIRARVVGITGRYQCAIYADNAGSPGAQLGSTLAVTNSTTGWQTFPMLSTVPLFGGTSYWLAIWSDDPNAQVYYAGTGTLKWGRYDYGAWPSPLATTGTGTFLYCIYATSGAAPVFNSNPTNRTINELTQLVVTNAATDADGALQPLAYYLLNPPTNAVISTAGVITWTPSEAQGPSTNVLTTAVTDGVLSRTNSFTVTVLEVNTAPTANPDTLARFETQGAQTPIATLLTNDTDPDGDLLTFGGVLSPTAQGATVTASNNWVRYDPVFGNTNADVFRYIINDGHGLTATGLVTVTITADPAVVEVLAAATDGSSLTVNFAGVPGFTYTIQATPSLSPATWQSLGVATADGAGNVTYVDVTAGSGSERFYRAVRGVAP